MKRYVFSALAFAVGFLPLAAAAQTEPGARPGSANPVLTVTGQGTVSRAPDQATVGLQIVTNNDAAATATSQNNTAYNALRARLSSLGIAESAIHTRSYNVSFVPKPTDNSGYKPPRTGYIVTRSLDVSLNDLSAVGRAIDAAVAAGVGEVSGVSYGFRDRHAVYNEALAAAVRDAASQAAAIAAAANLKLGGIRAINAGGGPGPRPLQVMGRVMAASMPAPSPPTEIQPSDIDVSANVTIVYELQR
ncbi:MAG: SIMPL domain-containing protein [Candidatus Eremiobacteraeota bacterium]|nr:SIMPL domain-containing protein [Candidatus Eremiobacteraeota bacterium]